MTGVAPIVLSVFVGSGTGLVLDDLAREQATSELVQLEEGERTMQHRLVALRTLERNSKLMAGGNTIRLSSSNDVF